MATRGIKRKTAQAECKQIIQNINIYHVVCDQNMSEGTFSFFHFIIFLCSEQILASCFLVQAEISLHRFANPNQRILDKMDLNSVAFSAEVLCLTNLQVWPVFIYTYCGFQMPELDDAIIVPLGLNLARNSWVMSILFRKCLSTLNLKEERYPLSSHVAPCKA